MSESPLTAFGLAPIKQEGSILWMGNYAEFLIPRIVVEQAKAINKEKSVLDKRTKGYKFLKQWAYEKDLKCKKELGL